MNRILLSLALTAPLSAYADGRSGAADVQAYIETFAGRTPHWGPSKRLMDEAREIALLIVSVADQYEIDYRALAVLARCESGFRFNVRGDLDDEDVGILQVNQRSWGRLVADLDLDTRRGQLEAGARVFASGVASCGSTEGGIVYYSIGRCDVPEGHRKGANIRHRIHLFKRWSK